MKPMMTDLELQLFESVLACSENYLEFGSGGSTCTAASRVKNSIISVDSSPQWIDRVRAACAIQQDWVQPQIFLVDIGPVGNWGIPIDPDTRQRWPNYHTRIWDHPAAVNADLFMVDGRFRVACCLQILLHARPDAVIAFHDYESRQHYHVVAQFLRPIARVEDLSIFLGRRDYDHDHVRQILQEYASVAN